MGYYSEACLSAMSLRSISGAGDYLEGKRERDNLFTDVFMTCRHFF